MLTVIVNGSFRIRYVHRLGSVPVPPIFGISVPVRFFPKCGYSFDCFLICGYSFDSFGSSSIPFRSPDAQSPSGGDETKEKLSPSECPETSTTA